MRRFRNLERVLDRITVGSKVWIPEWLKAVGSWEEVAEWKAILQASRLRRDRGERRLEFQRKMRQKHPDMPPTIEEEMKAGVEKLRKDLEWQKREGLIRESPATRT